MFLDSQMPVPCTTGNQAPSLSVSPVGGEYTIGETVQVSLTATDSSDSNPIIRYTVDDSTPTSSSPIYNSPITITTNTTVKAIAFDAEGLASNIISETYTFTEQSSGMTVYYKGNLTNPSIYFWNTNPASLTTSWPGENMTDIGNGWFSYTFDGVDCTNLIFSNNGANQTADLQRCGDGWYSNGTWYDEQPNSNDLKVYFKSDSFSDPEIYFWNTSPSNLTTSWPGESMQPEANGWYSYTFTDTNCANVIFSNNGNSQTADLSRCSEGWYYNGTWYDQNPNTLSSRNITLNNTKFLSNEMLIYPNALNEKSVVEVTNSDDNTLIKIEFINIYGTSQTIVDTKINSGIHKFKLNEIQDRLASGIYFCRVTLNGKSMIKKVIKK